jgi:transcriptional regulator with XRE-family HTH domain
MGKGKRARPKFLAKKLRHIRDQFGLSQNAMLRHLDLDANFSRAELSAYERGVREPPLQVLLSYSKTAGLWVNVLIDDELILPDRIPMKQMHPGKKRSSKRANVRKRERPT